MTTELDVKNDTEVVSDRCWNVEVSLIPNKHSRVVDVL